MAKSTPFTPRNAARDIGERYSKNLRHWLRFRVSGRHSIDDLVVFKDGEGILRIGYFFGEDFIGVRLLEVLAQGARAQLGDYGCPTEWKKIRGFWRKYGKIGVCAIDTEHIHYIKRWNTSGGRRICKYCGREERLEKWIHEVKMEKWVKVKKGGQNGR